MRDAASVLRHLTPWACGFVLSACGGEPPPLPRERTDLHSVLWVQTSAEHRAACLATFRSAGRALERALRDGARSAALEQRGDAAELPPAIVCDVDETLLDNSAYNARLLADPARPTFDIATWNAWVEEANAPALPGAVEFLQAAAASGVTVFYVTNRGREVEDATRRNLAAAGFPLPEASSELDVVLTRNDHDDAGSEKTPRRERVARSHRIVLMLGDDLGDFVPFARDKTRAERERIVETHGSRWGERWFVIPNPIYGSWWGALGEDPEAGLELRR